MKRFKELVNLFTFTLCILLCSAHNPMLSGKMDMPNQKIDNNISGSLNHSENPDMNNLKITSNKTDNCSQYQSCSSCMHFFGCIWCINQCTFYSNLEGYDGGPLKVHDQEYRTYYSFTYKATCFSSGPHYINNILFNNSLKVSYKFSVDKIQNNEIVFDVQTYYGLCPRLKECGKRILSLSEGQIDINLKYKLPQYAKCSWFIKTKRGTKLD